MLCGVLTLYLKLRNVCSVPFVKDDFEYKECRTPQDIVLCVCFNETHLFTSKSRFTLCILVGCIETLSVNREAKKIMVSIFLGTV